MTEIRKLWSGDLPAIPEDQLEKLRETADERVSEICETFWLFRYLHMHEDAEAALMGDYCFGRFSHHMTAADSVPLTDAFAEYLKQDTTETKDFAAFASFARGLDKYL